MPGQNPSVHTLAVNVVPNASRDEIGGWLGQRLTLRVCQPADASRANRSVEALRCDDVIHLRRCLGALG